jgi:hypothetical protein
LERFKERRFDLAVAKWDGVESEELIVVDVDKEC